ncbi:MAG: PRC-barrel domain-containing protein [Aquimonas sp.]|nr:PRC-barrel domain-containing protein [Aquimonas sp.]
MNYEQRDPYGIYRNKTGGSNKLNQSQGPGPQLMGANTLIGNNVVNAAGEDLGDIKEIMLDTSRGQVSYAVLSFGTFLGMGGKFFAVPWEALKLDTSEKRFVLDVSKQMLETAPGFDKDHWPDMADETWQQGISSHYGGRSHIGSPRN